jgi:putative ATP-grasp target RiPP
MRRCSGPSPQAEADKQLKSSKQTVVSNMTRIDPDRQIGLHEDAHPTRANVSEHNVSMHRGRTAA